MQKPNGICEACKKASQVIIDVRCRLGPLGPRGHWVFLCPVCHWIHGLNNDVITYRLFGGSYFEVPGRYRLTPDDIREGIKYYVDKAPSNETWKVVLLGEVAVQLAEINSTLKSLLDRKNASEPKNNIRLAVESSTFKDDMEDLLGKNS